MTPKAKAADVLRKAALHLQKVGWCQEHNIDSKGRHSMFFAVIAAMGPYRGDPEENEIIEEIHRSLDRIAGVGEWIDWNDKPGRTQGEVVGALLREARSVD